MNQDPTFLETAVTVFFVVLLFLFCIAGGHGVDINSEGYAEEI